MKPYNNLNQGVFLVQSGHRNDIAIIECPYVPRKIEVYEAHGLKILHGAQVFWTEVRRQYLPRRKGNREVINAVVVGIKHCAYLCDGKQILCTLHISDTPEGLKLQGLPVNHKLPAFDLVDTALLANYDLNLPEVRSQLEQKYFWAQLLCWNYEDAHPKGCLLGSFHSNYKTPQVEGEVLLHMLDISDSQTTFTKPRSLNKREYLPIKGHKQFSGLVFTIDPPQSIDIQDGLSLQSKSGGNWQLGVHISDVGAYKHLLNRRELAEKGTSTYLPHKTIHLLPLELVKLLALKPKRRRLTFSAFFQMDNNGKIFTRRFQKTVVRNAAQLSYQQAQQILDGRADAQSICQAKKITNQQYQSIEQKLMVLRRLTQKLRAGRSNTGMFDKNEVVFELDGSGMPVDIGVKQRLESQKLVQQCMILANCEVASKLVTEFGAQSLVIHHPRPLEASLDHLNDYLAKLGVKVRSGDMEQLDKEFRSLLAKKEIDDGLKQLLLLKAIQAQELAVYTRSLNSEKGHFGLSLENYTHFTSPMRRFADLMVHQQLQKCLVGQQLNNSQIVQLQQQIELINRARLRGKRLKQQAVECFINLYLYRRNESIRTKGFIIRLGLRSATIYLPLYNLIKDVAWSGGSTSYLDRDCVQLTMRHSGQQIKRQFQKNDALDVEISWEKHQEVQLKLILKTEKGEEIKI